MIRAEFISPKKSQLVSMFNAEVKDRYCKTAEDVPVMVSKEHGKKLCIVTLEWEQFITMLEALKEVAEV